MAKAIINGKVYTPDQVIDAGVVVIDDGKIVAVGTR